MKPNLTVHHILALLQICPKPDLRIPFVQRLAPLARDLDEGRYQLKSTLTEYDNIVCARALAGEDDFKFEDDWFMP